MAYVLRREGPRGTRYTGIYRDANGKPRSAGTFNSEERALSVASAKEDHDPVANKMDPAYMATVTITRYAEDFLRRHQVENVTKRGYASVIDCHILPTLGKERLSELSREQCRDWLADLQRAGMKPVQHRHCRNVLSAMMRMAVEDGYRAPLHDNPVKGLKTQRRGKKKLTVLTVEQFDDLIGKLPTRGARMFTELIVSSGMRYGEATALTPSDVDRDTRVLGIWKVASEVGANFHPDGRSRFELKSYTKDGAGRNIGLDEEVVEALFDYIEAEQIGPDELLFPIGRVLPESTGSFPLAKERPPLTAERLAELGTFEAANGRTYQHGSVNGYATGKCKCDACRQAISEYSSARRSARNPRMRGKQHKPRTTSENPQGYMPRDAWRRVWRKSVTEAGIPFMPTAYQLRHTHASWLADAGEELHKIKDRLGQKDLRVTSMYVTMVTDDKSSTDIMANLRNRRRNRA